MSDIEMSESGSPIYRHKAKTREWRSPENPALHLELIVAHLEKYVGAVETVYHEIASDLIHLDVLFIPPSAQCDCQTLVTSGVSDRRMAVPEGMEEFGHVELMIQLPISWPLDQESLKNEDHYWPIRWLKQVGRLPHDFDTWIGWGHTIPNGDPAERIANTRFIGVMLSPPYGLGADFFRLRTESGENISFYNLVPLYQEEMSLKVKKGSNALESLFEKNGIGRTIDPTRTNVARRRGWFR